MRIKLYQALTLAQMALAVRVKAHAGLRERNVEPDGGDRILELAAGTHVHVHVAARDQRHLEGMTDARECGELAVVRAPEMALDRSPQPAVESTFQPVELGFIGREAGEPEDEAAFERARDVRALEPVAALLRRTTPPGDEATEGCVSPPVRGQGGEAQPAGEPEFGADDELEGVAELLESRAGTHHPCDGAFVGDRKRGIPQLARAVDELFRAGSTPQESEVAEAVQLGITGRRGAVHRSERPGQRAVGGSSVTHEDSDAPFCVPARRFAGLCHP